MAETCWACARMAELSATGGIARNEFEAETNIALCSGHWNWWLLRFFASDDQPPCGAHLILTDESLITAMERHRSRETDAGPS